MEGVERDGREGSKRERVTLTCGAYHRLVWKRKYERG
jgi:hypothetical protein